LCSVLFRRYMDGLLLIVARCPFLYERLCDQAPARVAVEDTATPAQPPAMFVCCCSPDEDGKSKVVIVGGKAMEGPQPDEARPENSDAPLVSAGAKTDAPEAPRPVPVPVATKDGDIYNVVINKTPGGVLGLDLSLADGVTALVTGISPGPVKEWNDTAPEELKVLEGDRIIEVNGVKDSAKKVLQNLRDAAQIDLQIRRRTTMKISLAKGEGGLGLDVNCKRNREGLMILKMSSVGAMKDFNEANPDKAAQEQDRIIEVNGFRGEASMLLDKLKMFQNLDLVIVRMGLKSTDE